MSKKTKLGPITLARRAYDKARRALWRHQRDQEKHNRLTWSERYRHLTQKEKADIKYQAQLQRCLDGYRYKLRLVQQGKGKNSLRGIPSNIKSQLEAQL